MKVNIDTSELDTNLELFENRFNAALQMYCKTAATALESKAKRNRPWTDRTGDARKRLKGSSEVRANGARIVLAHGVDYGIWLELAHEKNWAIVEPTVRLDSNEIIQGMQSLVDNVRL